MSGLRLKLRAQPDERLDLSQVVPGALAGMPVIDIERLVIGSTRRRLRVADVFSVSGVVGDSLTIDGGSDRLDFVGAGHAGGTIVVEGDVGAYAGRRMRAGELDVRGSAGPWFASGLGGGVVKLKGAAGDNLGAPSAGERFGIAGGIVIIEGGAGASAGDRMRRGTVIVRGACGPMAGLRMMGGTIWAEGGFGEAPGTMMRRGTLIGPSVARFPPTFADCGRHELLILRILSRYLADALGALAPGPVNGPVRRWAGDMATIGKGEILLTA